MKYREIISYRTNHHCSKCFKNATFNIQYMIKKDLLVSVSPASAIG